MSLLLFCTSFVLPVYKHLPYTLLRQLCLHPHMCHLSASRVIIISLQDWDGKKPFSQCTGWLVIPSAFYRKNRVYFLSASQPQPVSKNVFLLVWQTKCVSLCVNVYILLYTYERTKWVYFFLCVCVLVLFQSMLFYVNRSVLRAALQNRITVCYMCCLLFVFYTFYLDENIPH